MPGKIFINYRRDDDPGFARALYQRLEKVFRSRDLFMDVEGHIKPGDDFVKHLNAQVAACDVLLAVIGPRWMELLDKRKDDPKDFVTIEIKAAFEQGKRVTVSTPFATTGSPPARLPPPSTPEIHMARSSPDV
jgi:hypothetical protein